jgi:hypothetical protein
MPVGCKVVLRKGPLCRTTRRLGQLAAMGLMAFRPRVFGLTVQNPIRQEAALCHALLRSAVSREIGVIMLSEPSRNQAHPLKRGALAERLRGQHRRKPQCAGAVSSWLLPGVTARTTRRRSRPSIVRRDSLGSSDGKHYGSANTAGDDTRRDSPHQAALTVPAPQPVCTSCSLWREVRANRIWSSAG